MQRWKVRKVLKKERNCLLFWRVCIYDETMEEKSCGIEKYSYFEVDDCRCHSCGKEFVSKGYICEYPIGVYDSHEIKTIKNEEAE